jgi:hypothetical protein
LRQDVCEAHEVDELSKLIRRTPQANLAATPPGRELEPRESIDRDGRGVEAADVAKCDTCAGPLDQAAHTLTKLLQIGTSDWGGKGESDRLRLWGGHLDQDSAARENSSVR